jgi:hypothetical protein
MTTLEISDRYDLTLTGPKKAPLDRRSRAKVGIATPIKSGVEVAGASEGFSRG